jgi:hypothetical protein
MFEERKLQKFNHRLDGYGRLSNRAILVFEGTPLPSPPQNGEWIQDARFDAEKERREASGFHELMRFVRKHGWAFVERHR